MNGHNIEAERLVASDPLPGDSASHVEWRIRAAQVHATLALVEEQRTANLIRLYDMGGANSIFAGLDYSALSDQILTRLNVLPEEEKP